MSPHPAKGLSMLELLLLLGAVSVLLAAALVAYPQVRENNRVNIEQRRLMRTVSILKTAFFSRGNYDTLTTDGANRLRAFDPEANENNFSPGQVIHNLWGGTIEVGPSATARMMELTYSGVSPDGCVKMATGTAHSFRKLTVNGTVVWLASMGQNMDTSLAVEACNQDPDGATLVFESE